MIREGDIVVCRDNSGIDCLYEGNVYRVLSVEEAGTSKHKNRIPIKTSEGIFFYKKERFDLVNFEKVKKINSWEDLNGLDNGRGLRIESRTGSLSEVIYGSECIKRLDKTYKLKLTVEKLNAMGFNIELVSGDTEFDIVERYKPNKFKKGVYDHRVWFTYGRYSTVKNDKFPVLGYCYYDKETTEKMCEELNELEGMGND
ncbi:MAG: hypothetical protein ACRC6V_09235 [Bacteroidales bacterium]